MFFKSSVGYLLFKYQKKKKIHLECKMHNKQRIERSQTTKCIQYNIHDTKSCELPNYHQIFYLWHTDLLMIEQ